jgi:tRNA G10  N-methylase Trm11
MEMRHLFGIDLKKNYFLSNRYIDASRSPFVKYCIMIDVIADSYETLLKEIDKKRISYENFKTDFINFDGDIEYEKGLEIEYNTGYIINGEAKLHDPDIVIGIIKAENKWILGRYVRSNGIWHNHDNKPRKYSNSLPAVMARALVNIAAPEINGIRMVDPCCGIGTVLLEALSMGIDIKGFDKNPKVVQGARENLLYFNYPNIIRIGNIHKMTEKYDTAIIDLPYGILSKTTSEAQAAIIKSSRNITNRLILVSIYEADEILNASGYKVIDKCTVAKGKLTRYVNLCI